MTEYDYSKYDAAFEEAVEEPKETKFSQVPPGKYLARITDVTFKDSPRGDPQISVRLKIESPNSKFNNRLLFKDIYMSQDVSDMSRLKADMKLLKVNLRPSEFHDKLPYTIIGKLVDVTLKYNDKGYSRVFFNKLIEEQQADDLHDEEIPF